MPVTDILPSLDSRLAAKLDEYLDRFDADLARAIRDQLRVLEPNRIRTGADATALLSDDRTDEEWAAVTTVLVAARSPRLSPAIARAFRAARSPTLKHYCVRALASTKGPTGRDALIDVLRGDDDADLRRHAADALGLFRRDGRVMRALLASLDDANEREEVRAWAARSLGLVGLRTAERPLIDALDDESALVRYWAADALGSIGGRRAVPALERVRDSDAAVDSRDGVVGDSADAALAHLRAKGLEP